MGSHQIQAALKIRKPANKRVLRERETVPAVNLPASLQTHKDGQLRQEQGGRKKITESQSDFIREIIPSYNFMTGNEDGGGIS